MLFKFILLVIVVSPLVAAHGRVDVMVRLSVLATYPDLIFYLAW
jgi:hypothetical protein